MKTFKEPVIFLIEGTSFEVDVALQLLRQTNDPKNVISFTRDMADHGTHYSLLYDPDRRCAQSADSDPQRVIAVNVPRLTDLDPEGMALTYGKSPAEVIGKTDDEVIVNTETLAQRHQGVLPVIHIADQSYIVDLRLKELRHLTDLSRSISLRRLELSATGDEYIFFYDLGRHEVVELDPKLTAFPDQVVLARIPNEIGLDPVAMAAAYGIDERQLLRRFTARSALQAQLVPLADTDIPALISRNRKHCARNTSRSWPTINHAEDNACKKLSDGKAIE